MCFRGTPVDLSDPRFPPQIDVEGYCQLLHCVNAGPLKGSQQLYDEVVQEVYGDGNLPPLIAGKSLRLEEPHPGSPTALVTTALRRLLDAHENTRARFATLVPSLTHESGPQDIYCCMCLELHWCEPCIRKCWCWSNSSWKTAMSQSSAVVGPEVSWRSDGASHR